MYTCDCFNQQTETNAIKVLADITNSVMHVLQYSTLNVPAAALQNRFSILR